MLLFVSSYIKKGQKSNTFLESISKIFEYCPFLRFSPSNNPSYTVLTSPLYTMDYYHFTWYTCSCPRSSDNIPKWRREFFMSHNIESAPFFRSTHSKTYQLFAPICPSNTCYWLHVHHYKIIIFSSNGTTQV